MLNRSIVEGFQHVLVDLDSRSFAQFALFAHVEDRAVGLVEEGVFTTCSDFELAVGVGVGLVACFLWWGSLD
jgi:hypothetical protein